MNILGMGPMEILLIVVLALIVFGPAKLPEIMGQVGKAIGDFRRATSELSDEFNRTIQAELQETRSVVDDTRSAVTGVHASINSALTGAPAPVRTAVPGEVAPVSNGTAAEPATNGISYGTGTASATPPLADTSQWSWETAAPAPVKPAVELATAPNALEIQAEPAPPAEAPAATVEAPLPPPPARKAKLRDELLPPY
jgi:TatA/E family protein of Tat protein translocase